MTPRTKHSQSEARHSLIGTYRNVATSNDALADELRQRADDFEKQELGHECGHLFTITASSVMHSSIVGGGLESHRDSEPESNPITFSVKVRANSLGEACRKAAAIQLNEWDNDYGHLERYSGDSKVEATFHDGTVAGSTGAGGPAT